METTFKSLLGLERAVCVSNTKGIPANQLDIIEQVKDFGIDEIYFSTDEKSSYPAAFIKKVSAFDEATLKVVAKIQKKLWNYQKVLFLYVYTDTEIRIYNCSEKPFNVTDKTDFCEELKKIEISQATINDKKALNNLVSLFSAIAVDSGTIWTSPEAVEIRKKINLQRRVDKYLVDSLKRATDKLVELGLINTEVTHKIILRSLFLLYLEDRGATDASFYKSFNSNANSYFDILNDTLSTYKLYSKLEEQFNGNVFSLVDGEQQIITNKHLEIIKKCFINGYENDGQTELFENWRLFDFKIIRIELLSEIFERFLEETNPKGKKNAGAYYTPPSLVELILNEVLPIGKQYTNYNVKILDPACGSGIFLVASYKRLLKRYENAHKKQLTDFTQLKKLLTDNIYGIELNDQAIVVAAFSLYLALVDNLDPKTLWQNKTLPCLINNPDKIEQNKQGNNLFCRDTISDNDEVENISFDLVVGNPPFGTENKSKGVELSSSIRAYCAKEKFAKEMVLPFLHKAAKFAPNGKIALIFNTKILTNTSSTYQNFRKWLFNECYVEKIYNFSILRNAPQNYGGQLFSSAIGPICIAFYQKEEPIQKSDRIVYYAPKTFIKSNILEGVVIDSTDVKYLPREECKKPDTKIWKIAMWGVNADYNFLNYELANCMTLNDYLKKNSFICGVGFETGPPANKFNNLIHTLPIHTPKNVDLYITDVPQKSIRVNKFRRLGSIEIYQKNHIIINEGIKVGSKGNLQIRSSYVDYNSAYSKGIIGIASTDDANNDMLKIITLILNSSYVRYYAFLVTSSWGIERDVVKHKELFCVKFPFNKLDNKDRLFLIGCYDKIVVAKKKFEDFSNIVQQIDDFVYTIIGANYKVLINNTILNIDLFQKQTKSKALLPVLSINEYIQAICIKLNDFLDGQNLYANGTTFQINRATPLIMVKISFGKNKEDIQQSSLRIENELKQIDKHLWKENGGSIYFRKKVNYYDGDDIYLIRPNQRRFWTQSMAMEDASELILEILNKD